MSCTGLNHSQYVRVDPSSKCTTDNECGENKWTLKRRNNLTANWTESRPSYVSVIGYRCDSCGEDDDDTDCTTHKWIITTCRDDDRCTKVHESDFDVSKLTRLLDILSVILL